MTKSFFFKFRKKRVGQVKMHLEGPPLWEAQVSQIRLATYTLDIWESYHLVHWPLLSKKSAIEIGGLSSCFRGMGNQSQILENGISASFLVVRWWNWVHPAENRILHLLSQQHAILCLIHCREKRSWNVWLGVASAIKLCVGVAGQGQNDTLACLLPLVIF